jgi:excisionase family DNA binding protein
METNAQGRVVPLPPDTHRRSLAGRGMSHDTFTKDQNEPVAKTKLLTVEQVADLLHVPRSWVYGRTRARDRDRLPGLRLGKYWRFREADVLAWLETQKL